LDLPPRFPDPQQEAASRAREFQQLSAAERLAAMLDTIAAGMYLRSISPQREAIDRIFLEKEAAAQRIQQELIRRHG
jgi:hypothetical protein